MPLFESLFKTGDLRQDNLRSRLFGMFSEDIVRIWARDPRAHYHDLGRPTLWKPGEPRGATLDFTLERKTDGQRFVAEQKAELAFDAYRYLTLKDPSQLGHHTMLPAFARFLEMARHPADYEVRVGAKPIEVHGSILVWGAVDADGRRVVIDKFGFADVLSLEEMVNDLKLWRNPDWFARLAELRGWTDGLLDGLTG